jgi:protein-disulfide isomerase
MVLAPKSAEMSNKIIFAGAALLMVLVLAVAVYVDQAGRAPASRPAARADSALLVRPDSPSLGRPDAKVTLVEFLDPACETCATFYPEVKRMLAANPDRLRVVTRHVPFHAGSDAVVRMLEAARLQDKYWPALDALLGAQSQWVFQHKVNADQALVVLGNAGLDIPRLRSDMERDPVRARVAQDWDDAKALRVQQTPEYFVNGRPLPTFGLDELRALVNDELRATR